jgi:YggT family protein
MVQMLLGIIQIILSVVTTLIFVQFIMSILITFNVINTYNEAVRVIWQALETLTEPLYRPIRKILPDLGPLDLSPLVVLIIIRIIQGPVMRYIVDITYGF